MKYETSSLELTHTHTAVYLLPTETATQNKSTLKPNSE